MRFKPTEIATIAVAGIALVGAVVSAFYTYANRNRELDIKLVEIGIGILRADPKETGLTAARGWAVQVIEDNSRVKFSEADRRTLLQKPLLFRALVPPRGGASLSWEYLGSELGFTKQQIEEIFKRQPLTLTPD